jgi:formylglycine-generating enzyme required for sulfatase activity
MNTADGYFSMSPTAVYFPNGMGLYDVVGNVAEMTDEKGKACGGSWNHPPEESTIKSINVYKGPDAAIGFRILMEVIEP